MSTHYSATSSASSRVATTSTQPTHPVDNRLRLMIAGIVLGIIGLLCVAGIIFATLRMKRTDRKLFDDSESFTSPLQDMRLDHHHPAAQITPFGSVGDETEGPRFKHIPGSNMRMATRRSDGVWQFHDTKDLFTPAGVSEIDVIPPAKERNPRVHPRTTDSKSSWNLSVHYDRHYQSSNDISLPPPVYGYNYSGYIPPHKVRHCSS
ncbi:hypothetical protein E4T56_gene12677 [Termitomyces sp. T112]|nr:hypothetical protein E4T56_gene12677 [Termitomyces sp. T112]KAH0588373.1 hypothetical protein H2248_004230 [Termitomyces sp. 'cryptogamus']